MKITIPYESWDADLQAARSRHSNLAGTKRPINGGTEFTISDHLMPQADVDMFFTKNVRMDQVAFYIEVDVAVLDADVDVRLPDSKHMDYTDPELPVEVAKKYRDYVPSYTVSNDGLKAIIPCCHKTSATTAMGCDDEEIRAWNTVFPLSIMVFGARLAMNETPNYVSEII